MSVFFAISIFGMFVSIFDRAPDVSSRPLPGVKPQQLVSGPWLAGTADLEEYSMIKVFDRVKLEMASEQAEISNNSLMKEINGNKILWTLKFK